MSDDPATFRRTYEYDRVNIKRLDLTDPFDYMQIVRTKAEDGWRLHSIYPISSDGTTSSVDLVFERLRDHPIPLTREGLPGDRAENADAES